MITAELITASRAYPIKRIALVIALSALALYVREHLVAAGLFALTNLWQMTPIVLAGLLITSVLTATGSIGLLVAAFNGRQISAVVLVSLIGAVLPVCGITVLPLVAGLLSAGVPLAPVMAFLLSSAVTDPEMFAITVATLGLPFATGKTLAALGIGLLGGTVTLAMVRLGRFDSPTRQSSLLTSLTARTSCSEPTRVQWQFWRDRQRLEVFTATSWGLAKMVVLWLGAAFVAEYFLRLYVPEDALAALVGRDNPYAVPLAAMVGTPLYLDGYAALPFVRGLIDRGMAEGAAMAFLVAGGITSAWTAIPVFALFRLPIFLAYIILALVGSMLAGWAYSFSIS